MKTIDQIYLERLCKGLQSLSNRLNKGKPGSAYSKSEIQAFRGFTMQKPAGLSSFVRNHHTSLWLISELPEVKRTSAIFYLQLLLSQTVTLLHLVNEGDCKKLNLVYRELKAHTITDVKRKELKQSGDTTFETMMVKFLKTGNIFNDHIYKNVDMLPRLYIPLLEYYLKHKKEISGTRQWYDFLAISNYMLNGIKLEILQLQRLKKR